MEMNIHGAHQNTHSHVDFCIFVCVFCIFHDGQFWQYTIWHLTFNCFWDFFEREKAQSFGSIEKSVEWCSMYVWDYQNNQLSINILVAAA